MRALTETGWLAALIPARYGGLGLGIQEAAAILQEINHQGGNAGTAHAQMYVMGALLRHGSEAQKARYLPHVASGALRLQAFAVTEPGSGTDTTRIETTAVRDGDDYIVDGRKNDISRVQHSDLMLLLARTAPRHPERPTAGLTLFLVDLAQAGGEHPATLPADDDEQRDERDDDRRAADSGRQCDRRGGPGIPSDSRWLERRAHPHCRGVRRRWTLVYRAGCGVRDDARSLRQADWGEPGCPVSLGLGLGRMSKPPT